MSLSEHQIRTSWYPWGMENQGDGGVARGDRITRRITCEEFDNVGKPVLHSRCSESSFENPDLSFSPCVTDSTSKLAIATTFHHTIFGSASIPIHLNLPVCLHCPSLDVGTVRNTKADQSACRNPTWPVSPLSSSSRSANSSLKAANMPPSRNCL